MSTQTEAERLADWLTRLDVRTVDKIQNCVSAAAELRRLDADNKDLRAKLAEQPAPVQSAIDKMWETLAIAQHQADANGHGETWAAMCSEKTAAAANDAGAAAFQGHLCHAAYCAADVYAVSIRVANQATVYINRLKEKT